MNRLELLDYQPDEALSPSPRVEATPPHESTIRGVCHSVFVPLHYEENYAYPLLVWLHGPGENEQQLRHVLPHISMRNYVAIAPRGTQGIPDHDSPHMRYTWRQTDDDIILSEHRILECIRLAKQRFHIAPDRVFLIGHETGGTMALRLGLMHPEQFAGIASVGGQFPAGHTPLVRINQARHLQILIAHSLQSSAYTETAVCNDLRLLHAAGMSIVLRQYHCQPQLTDRMLSDVDEWIMGQVTGAIHDDSSGHHSNWLN